MDKNFDAEEYQAWLESLPQSMHNTVFREEWEKVCAMIKKGVRR